MSTERGCPSLAHGIALLAAIVAPSTYGMDAVAECAPLPKVLRFDQPVYPPNIEPRGLPSPVTLVVEFTITAEGRAIDVLVVESDAGSYARAFSEQAVRAVAGMQFDSIPKPCHGRMKVVFKIAD